MERTRRQFIIELSAIAGIAASDGFGLLSALPHSRAEAQTDSGTISKDLKDHPHITDVISTTEMEAHFPIIVEACSDPKLNYLSQIPFLIELEVCKIWKESLFKWSALSNMGAGGLQQLMETTARDALGLTIVDSSELAQFKSLISEYLKLRNETSAKRQELYKEVESGSGDITVEQLARLNKLRAELADLESKKDPSFEKLKSAKEAYIAKIVAMTPEERRNIDARFVPELAIPAGVKYLVQDILECVKYFGGSVEMNTWRGIAAYNSGLQRTKDWKGLPYIFETVQYTRDIISDLTKMIELKKAYSTGDSDLIAKTKQRLRL